MRLHRIDPEPSPEVRNACDDSEVVAEVVAMTHGLYGRKGFVPPWTCYLAEMDDRIVGTCGFAGPPANGEAEIAYFTFPGNEGRGIAREMAAALMREARSAATAEVFIAHTLPAEGPSTAILKRLGFAWMGVIDHPEDGPVWKWRLRDAGSAMSPDPAQESR